MRILQLAQFYPPVIGGEERHVRNLSAGLAARGHDVHVGTLDVGGEPPVTDPGVTVHQLDSVGRRVPALYPTSDRPLSLPVPDPLTVRDLSRLLAEVRPDVVHAHNWLVNSYLALPSAGGVPLVLSLHDYGHVCATKRLMFQGAPCSGPSPRKCVPCSQGHYGSARGPVIWSMVRGGRPARNRRVNLFTPVSRAVASANALDDDGLPWQLVPNFVPDELAAIDPPRDPGLPAEDYLFFAGDLLAQKGVTTLLRAYDALPPDRPRLVLVGRPSADLPARIPEGVVLDHGWPHERVVAGFAHALAAVLPSEWPDPCPTTVLEAMAIGAPLVTTHQGGIADMVRDQESALVVRPGDVDALTEALRRVIGDPALRARLTAGAARDVRPFLLSSVLSELEATYDRLAAG